LATIFGFIVEYCGSWSRNNTLSLVKELSPSTSLLFERFFLVRNKVFEVSKNIGIVFFTTPLVQFALTGGLNKASLVLLFWGVILLVAYIVLD